MSKRRERTLITPTKQRMGTGIFDNWEKQNKLKYGVDIRNKLRKKLEELNIGLLKDESEINNLHLDLDISNLRKMTLISKFLEKATFLARIT